MKFAFSIAVVALLIFQVGCRYEEGVTKTDEQPKSGETTNVADQIVEASCGQCQLGLTGEGCDLAVRIDGKAYYVDGSNIDDHGDAHGEDGMCNCVRKAKVRGEIKDGRFVATSFEVLPHEEGGEHGKKDGDKGHDHKGDDKDGDDHKGHDKDGDEHKGHDKDGDDHKGHDKDGDHKDGDHKDGDHKDGDHKDGDHKDGDHKGHDKDGDHKDDDHKHKDGDDKDGGK